MKLLEIFNQLLSEGKSRGVLYHFVNSVGFKSNIINQGFNFHELEYEYEDLPKYSKYKSALSCTRLYNLRWGSFRFNLNGDYISNTYAIMPVHYFNISDKRFDNLTSDNRTRGHNNFQFQGVPVNQFEESIYSKESKHNMPLNNKNVYSVDILIRDGVVSQQNLEVKYTKELAELVSLGIPYNFVSEFKPFNGVKNTISMSDIKSSVNELLKLRTEDEFIKFLDGREDMKKILSDSRVISSVCSRGYTKVLKKMVDIDVNLGLSDYEEQSWVNSYGDVRTSTHEEENIIALKSAKNNKEVLSILVSSKYIPVEFKLSIIRKNDLFHLNHFIYDSDIDVRDKASIAALGGDLKNFNKYLPDVESKNTLFMVIHIAGKKHKNILNRYLNDDDVEDSVKDRLKRIFNIE